LSVLCVCVCVLDEAHVRWVPCHHGMARHQVADGGDYMLNKQSWRADKGWSSRLGVGLTTPHCKK
jgi:hypothetical protein